MQIGTKAFGVKLPVIKEGDDLSQMIVDSLKKGIANGEFTLENGDIFGLTESIVARAKGQYVTVNEVAEELKNLFPGQEEVIVFNPIFSRNRFSIILRAIARAFSKVTILYSDPDEVGNVVEHPITKVNYLNLYKEVCKEENSKCFFKPINDWFRTHRGCRDYVLIDCTLHPELFVYPKNYSDVQFEDKIGLKDICTSISEWGLLGSNKMSEELLKLYPDSSCMEFVNGLKELIESTFNLTNVEVMIYGDGCFKDADSGIWEFADPQVSPAYTKGLIGGPAELKFKYLADNEFAELKGEELEKAIKNRIANKKVQQGDMETQGTTPRNYVNLLGSLMDLISGSGDKGTPLVVVQGYFKNYATR